MRERPIRILAGTSTLVVVSFYLVAQMVGAGELISLLFGIGYGPAVIMVGLLMIVFSTLGGMRAATWVQIIKAILMIGGSAMIATLVLARFGFNVSDLFKTATSHHPSGNKIMDIRGFAQDAVATLSLGVGILFGTAGLPHILMRFFTVSDERAARVSVFYATCLIGLFFAMLFVIGYGIALLRGDAAYANASGALFGGNNLAPIHLARAVGGSILAGFISAVAFATILAVVSGLLIAGASSAANDLVVGLSGRQLDERMRLRISRIAAMALGVLGILLGLACAGAERSLPPCACHSDSSQRQLSIAAPGNLLGRFDDAWCGHWRHLRPCLVGCFDGDGADYLVEGTRSWPCDLSRTTRQHCSRCPSRCLICWLMSIATAEFEKDWQLAQPSVAQYVEP